MAKYLLFQNNEFYRMAPNEAKRDNWLRTPDIVAKEVSDADYKKVGCKKWTSTPTLSGDTINYNEETNFHFNENVPEDNTDASACQAQLAEFRDNLIIEFKHFAAQHYDNDAEVKAMVAFLEGIDTSAVTSFAANQSIFEYIYDLPGCPQIYPLELFY
tara:strand:+ start:737 stop:1210 length:474 start_codon:yes stop_codon:yes gene_type:complete